jgi:hypothetical protein
MPPGIGPVAFFLKGTFSVPDSFPLLFNRTFISNKTR